MHAMSLHRGRRREGNHAEHLRPQDEEAEASSVYKGTQHRE